MTFAWTRIRANPGTRNKSADHNAASTRALCVWYQYVAIGNRIDRTRRSAIVADALTRHVAHMLALTAEVKKLIIDFRALPAPAVPTVEETEIRHRLERALCRVHIGLITAPTVTASMLCPTVHWQFTYKRPPVWGPSCRGSNRIRRGRIAYLLPYPTRPKRPNQPYADRC